MTTLLVASEGGHLAELNLLSKGISPAEDRVWVTFDNPQSRSLLAGEVVHFAPFVGSRDLVGTARAALVRIAASVEIATLLSEIENSTARISDLVRAIKEYTYMDQTPVQNVDIVKSLETTLTIMNHKLKRGVVVQRDYQRVPLLVNSFGSELNQVWTNIIDNAIDAMSGKGELRVRTYRDDDCVVVEIGDNGPGIPEDIKAHIFEPFFTTKRVGEGTGLGLDTTLRIVKKHRGNIQVSSKPGDTRFQVWLPLAEKQAEERESPAVRAQQ